MEQQMTAKIIFIAGPSGSGKSWLSHQLLYALNAMHGPNYVQIIQEDSYYSDQSQLSFPQRELQNYDIPGAFDHLLLEQHLIELAKGNAVDIPVYDFTQHTRSSETLRFEPSPVLIVEGILLLSQTQLVRHAQLKVYIDTPLDICLFRRIQRDIKERARTADSVINQYKDTVRPAWETFVKPSESNADYTLNGELDSDQQLQQLLTLIEQ
jgi:uridine kinase